MRETGEKARAWKGMDAGYVAKHMWIVRHHGKATKCKHCSTRTAKRYEWANLSGEYKREISDYRQLCPSCHRKFDHGMLCKRGHFLTKDNVYLTKQGWRNCRKCIAIRSKKYYAKNH